MEVLTSNSHLELESMIQKDPGGALRLLYERYAKTLYGLICVRIQEEADAEEILTKCFEALYKELLLLRVEASYLPFLIDAARNMCDEKCAAETTLKVEKTIDYVDREQYILQWIINDGESVAQVAEKLSIPINEVKKLLRNAITKFKKFNT